jgi:hypothetical protein
MRMGNVGGTAAGSGEVAEEFALVAAAVVAVLEVVRAWLDCMRTAPEDGYAFKVYSWQVEDNQRIDDVVSGECGHTIYCLSRPFLRYS